MGDAIKNNPGRSPQGLVESEMHRRLICVVLTCATGFIQLRRIAAAKEIAETISSSTNKVYLGADSLMLNNLGKQDVGIGEGTGNPAKKGYLG